MHLFFNIKSLVLNKNNFFNNKIYIFQPTLFDSGTQTQAPSPFEPEPPEGLAPRHLPGGKLTQQSHHQKPEPWKSIPKKTWTQEHHAPKHKTGRQPCIEWTLKQEPPEAEL